MDIKWRNEDNAMKATLKFKDFIEAWAFMNQVAITAEKMNHHPDWSNVYNTVHITLSTHDAGNTVTEKDIALSKAIDNIYTTYSKS